MARTVCFFDDRVEFGSRHGFRALYKPVGGDEDAHESLAVAVERCEPESSCSHPLCEKAPLEFNEIISGAETFLYEESCSLHRRSSDKNLSLRDLT